MLHPHYRLLHPSYSLLVLKRTENRTDKQIRWKYINCFLKSKNFFSSTINKLLHYKCSLKKMYYLTYNRHVCVSIIPSFLLERLGPSGSKGVLEHQRGLWASSYTKGVFGLLRVPKGVFGPEGASGFPIIYFIIYHLLHIELTSNEGQLIKSHIISCNNSIISTGYRSVDLQRL